MKKAKITPQQKAYVEARGKGIGRDQSALIAGYAPGGSVANATRIENSLTVQAQLMKIRKEAIENSGVTKEDVIQMLVDAADMAKVMADPTGMVAAARELGKMLGFYAPEVKKVTHGLDANSLRAMMDSLDDADLQRIANAQAIEGVATRIAIDAPNKDTGRESGSPPAEEDAAGDSQEDGDQGAGGEEGGE